MRSRILAAILAFSTIAPTWRVPFSERVREVPAQVEARQDPRQFYQGLLRKVEGPLTPPSDEPERIYDSLTRVLAAFHEYAIPYAPPMNTPALRFLQKRLIGGQGVTIPATNSYYVNDSLPPVKRTIALAHEMAHAQLYLRESDAEALACLTLLNSDDAYLRACGLYERLLLEGVSVVPPALAPLLKSGQTRNSIVVKQVEKAYDFFVPVRESYVEKPRRIIHSLEARLGCEGVMQLCQNS